MLLFFTFYCYGDHRKESETVTTIGQKLQEILVCLTGFYDERSMLEFQSKSKSKLFA